LGAVSITGPTSGSVVSFADCNYAGGLTVAGIFSSATFKGGQITGGSLLYTAVGGVIDVAQYNNDILSWNPTLKFGGNNVGIVQSFTFGNYSITNKTILAEFIITLTNKGSSTGIATIEGLPFAVNHAIGSTVVQVCSNMQSLANTVIASPSSSVIYLQQFNSTGTVSLTDSNFTNTTSITGSVSYLIP
jgi:hypothetical protein